MFNRIFLISMAAIALAIGISVTCCADSQINNSNTISEPVAIAIDLDKTYQEIEGFGFFGARDVWWATGNASRFYTDEWADKVIDDLGITMWRNEIAPNVPVNSGDWPGKQEPVIRQLYNRAKAKGVDLKVILTVWSPPGEFKTNGTTINGEDGKSPNNGGTLKPEKYQDYANWLVSALDMYKNCGVDVYGLSLQNEPMFNEPYNSCVYTGSSYVNMMNAVVPAIHAKYPKVKIFGSEHMLEAEHVGWNPFDSAIRDDKTALGHLHAFSVHGYSDGVLASAASTYKLYWGTYSDRFYSTGKSIWMSEISGYTNDSWVGASEKSPGAFDYALAIASALKYGHASAWVHWQGSENMGAGKLPKEFINGTNLSTGKQYSVAQHFYRFIRPGAEMVDAAYAGNDLLVVAFKHTTENKFICVLINSSDGNRIVTLNGVNVPDVFDMYETTSDNNVNFRLSPQVANGEIVLKAKSIITLVK